jgi:multidrug resistance efflux pump
MKRQRIIPILIVALVVVVAGGAGLYFYTNPAVWQRTLTELELAEPEARGLTASGFIEAEEVDIAPELGGRVADLLVDEGDDAEAGELLVRIDGTLLEAQIDLAEAGVQIAQAQLAQVMAGARPAVIRQAEADLAQAEAAREGAYQVWQDTMAIRDNPQELDAEITGARSEVETAQAELAEAAALKDAAVITYEQYSDAKDSWEDKKENLREKLRDLPEDMRPSIPNEIPAQLDFHMIPYQHWKAWVGVNAAEAALQGARIALDDLLAMRSNPQDLDAQVDAAETEYQAARATVDQAEAQLAALRSGATQEEIATAEAQVEQAQASLDKLLDERNKLSIAAPVGGLVLTLSIHEGELAAPGATMLTLGDLDEVTLTVYVPEDRLGHVNIGQDVEVQVDSYPNRVFKGTVVAIADEAEFTPRNVQTKEERVNMVFAVDVRIPNPDHELKPGVPADATLLTEKQ